MTTIATLLAILAIVLLIQQAHRTAQEIALGDDAERLGRRHKAERSGREVPGPWGTDVEARRKSSPDVATHQGVRAWWRRGFRGRTR